MSSTSATLSFPVLLLVVLLPRPLLCLQCVVGNGMLSQPENFAFAQCEGGNAVCFKKFGKDLGDQMMKGCAEISDEVRRKNSNSTN